MPSLIALSLTEKNLILSSHKKKIYAREGEVH
jgi:hypothetical protein